GLAAGFNYAGANQKFVLTKLGVAHAILVALEVIGLDTNGLSQFQVGGRVGPLAKPPTSFAILPISNQSNWRISRRFFPVSSAGYPFPAKSQREAPGAGSGRRFLSHLGRVVRQYFTSPASHHPSQHEYRPPPTPGGKPPYK